MAVNSFLAVGGDSNHFFKKKAKFGMTMAVLLLIYRIPHVVLITPASRLIDLLWLSPAFGIVIVLLIFLLRRKSQDKVRIDERDSCISRRALIAAFSLTAGLFICVCMIGPFIAKPTTSIPVLLLPALVYSLFVVFILAYSVVVLIQYWWRGKGEKS